MLENNQNKLASLVLMLNRKHSITRRATHCKTFLVNELNHTYRSCMANSEIILEGSYLYYQKDVNYSQENFKFVHVPDSQIYFFNAEILSRIETGEFLKILVRYEMNQHFTPTAVRIEKSIGNRYALETFKLDVSNFELFYTFQNSNVSQEFKRTVSAKHYLTSPAFCTTAIFTLTRKFDATGRTPVVVISSDNDWEYSGPPTEKILYSEFKSREMSDFQLNGNHLSAAHLCLYEHDSSQPGLENPVDLYLSKHYAVPYKLEHEDQKIVIKNLKKNTL